MTTSNEQNKKIGSFIVSWDFSRNDENDVLLVGNQINGKVLIVNAFQGKKAHDIYDMLSSVKNGGFK